MFCVFCIYKDRGMISKKTRCSVGDVQSASPQVCFLGELYTTAWHRTKPGKHSTYSIITIFPLFSSVCLTVHAFIISLLFFWTPKLHPCTFLRLSVCSCHPIPEQNSSKTKPKRDQYVIKKPLGLEPDMQIKEKDNQTSSQN